MANRVKIQRKYHPPQADQTRAARTQRGGRRQFLARVTEKVTAATFDNTTDKLTLGTGKVTPIVRDANGTDSKELEDVDTSQVYDVYNVTNVASADPVTHYVVVWVIQSDTDGDLYYFEPCDSFALE